MRLINLVLAAFAGLCLADSTNSTKGIEDLLKRRLPLHANRFSFTLTDPSLSTSVVNVTSRPNDQYTVSNGDDDIIEISGTTLTALSSGLRWYLFNYAHVDIYWFIGSTLELATELPPVNETYSGESIVPFRYHFNTVTFSYTAAFWTWDDWQLQIDWMALRGINLPLAWVGYEKIYAEVLLEYGFSEAEIYTYLSGPAFQAWNRFGNIQASWGGDLTSAWVDAQFAMQKKIVARMVELGMTPVMPCFTGFVPYEIATLYPNASIVNGSEWNSFPTEYTNVTFLEPFDPLYAKMQKSFIRKQKAAFGDVSNIYTLDQYNENDPSSGDASYLKKIAKYDIAALKAADENAIWIMQGWLFYSSETFWTTDRVEAFLGAVDDSDMLIIDLFSESEPQWQRTNSYYGKPWLWCQLHGYGGNMGLYGQVLNATINPVEALDNTTSTMVGMGLTMEGQEGNQVIYDILLDQAWSTTALDSDAYFYDWASTRYHASTSFPEDIYTAWDMMRQTVYNNTDLDISTAETKSIFVLHPNTTGLLNVTGHHATVITYNTTSLIQAWKKLHHASHKDDELWDNDAYAFDLTDVTRQVMANHFYPLYEEFLATANSSLSTHAPKKAEKAAKKALRLLTDLDAVLLSSGQAHFSLPAWIEAASARASSDSAETSFYEYDARNQITLWGPMGQITDYASKQWGGLISSYYVPRWQMFFEYTLNSTTEANGENTALTEALLAFEEAWQTDSAGDSGYEVAPTPGRLKDEIHRVVREWPEVFGK